MNSEGLRDEQNVFEEGIFYFIFHAKLWINKDAFIIVYLIYNDQIILKRNSAEHTKVWQSICLF